jgi:hypothetical protein
MAVLATDTWTGTTGASWAAQWSTPTTSGTALISNNKGALTPSGNGYKNTRVFLTGLAVRADTEVYVEVTAPSPLDETYVDISVRAQQNAEYYPSGYYVRFAPAAGNWYVFTGSGTSETNGTTIPFTYTAGATYGIRIQVVGTTINARMWNLTGAEPTTWGVTKTDTTYATGYVAIGAQSGVSTNPSALVDNMSVNDTIATVVAADTTSFFQFF